MMRNLFILAGLFAITLPAMPMAQTVGGDSPLYVIMPNDVLEVFVWKEPDLSRKVLVRPDGRISFPLVQDLQAAGLTPGELKEKIEVLLQDYLSTPNVTVIVDAIQHYRIYVTGKVNSPGSFMMEKPITVLQAISFAGGFAEFADENEIKIVRVEGANYQYLDFKYKDVIKGKNTEQNIVLRSGDVVVVP
jgi:polysaccharide export outer membrane protein